MKTFTKNMLIPGKHVVETRKGKRYLVLECNGEIYLTNFIQSFNSLSNFDENMMKIFIIKHPSPLGEWIFEDRNLTEIWHREEIFITPDEKAILRNIKGYEYIARDLDGRLYLFSEKPTKNNEKYVGYGCRSFLLFMNLYHMVQWYDDEPWKIEDLLKLPEKEGDTK